MTRVTGIAPQPYAIQIDASAGAHGGIAQTLNGRVAPGWHVLEVDVTLLSGTLNGAGVYMHWGPTGGIAYSDSLSFVAGPDISGTGPGTGTVNKLYKFRKLVNVITAADLCQIFVMSHWEGFGQSIASANSLKFHRAALRPASQAEIEARQAKLDLVTTNANVATNTSAIASANSAISSLTTTVSANHTAATKVNRNLLPNSTGLKGTAGWTVPTGWAAYKHPQWGEWFYRVFTGLSGITETFYSEAIPAQAGATYHYSAVPYLAGLTSGDARFFLAFYNSGGSWIGESSIWLNGAMTGARQTASIVAPTGTATFRFGQQLISATGDGGYAEIGFWQGKVEAGGSTAWRADDELQDSVTRIGTAEAAIIINATAIATETSARASAVEEVRAYLSNKGDCIHDEFRDNTFWNLPLSGVSLIDTDGGWRWRRAIQLSNGTYDHYSDFFPVEPGATYRIRCRIWNNAGSWSGYFHPLIHMPYYAWYSLKHGTAVDPSVHDSSNGIVAAGDTGNLEWIVTNPTGITDNANRQWQFRFLGSFTGGPVVIACEIVRLDQYATVNTIKTALTAPDGSTALLAFEANAAGVMTGIKLISVSSGHTTPISQIIMSASDIILAADAINFGSNTIFEDAYDSFYTEAGGRRNRFGGPFPASGDLLEWFGPTTVALNSETKTNGYWAKGTDGKIYHGAAEIVAPTTDDQTKTGTAAFDNVTTSGTTVHTLATIDLTVGASGYLELLSPLFYGPLSINQESGMTLSAGTDWFGQMIVTEQLQSGGTEHTLWTIPLQISDTGGGLFDFIFDPPVVKVVAQNVSGASRYRIKLQRTSGSNNVSGNGLQGKFTIRRTP